MVVILTVLMEVQVIRQVQLLVVYQMDHIQSLLKMVMVVQLVIQLQLLFQLRRLLRLLLKLMLIALVKVQEA